MPSSGQLPFLRVLPLLSPDACSQGSMKRESANLSFPCREVRRAPSFLFRHGCTLLGPVSEIQRRARCVRGCGWGLRTGTCRGERNSASKRQKLVVASLTVTIRNSCGNNSPRCWRWTSGNRCSRNQRRRRRWCLWWCDLGPGTAPETSRTKRGRTTVSFNERWI